ncbi:hypothetical protein COW95_03850 [Candidatus Peregrinibacteria bacterium CG22_combo_CG10-13_8_21_14_all_49_11]|nr:MAG: hypothetical protein COW95_03850 [Candidatus Peregrinibacteria bacterium CG22_combo_CG10-13_8_21_14_all_49_11]
MAPMVQTVERSFERQLVMSQPNDTLEIQYADGVKVTLTGRNLAERKVRIRRKKITPQPKPAGIMLVPVPVVVGIVDIEEVAYRHLTKANGTY